MARTSAADLAYGLKGANLPVSRDELDLARETGAAEDIIETLEALPEQSYRSLANVEQAFGDRN